MHSIGPNAFNRWLCSNLLLFAVTIAVAVILLCCVGCAFSCFIRFPFNRSNIYRSWFLTNKNPFRRTLYLSLCVWVLSAINFIDACVLQMHRSARLKFARALHLQYQSRAEPIYSIAAKRNILSSNIDNRDIGATQNAPSGPGFLHVSL